MPKTWVDERVRTPAGRQQIRLEIRAGGWTAAEAEAVEAEMADIEKALERAA